QGVGGIQCVLDVLQHGAPGIGVRHAVHLQLRGRGSHAATSRQRSNSRLTGSSSRYSTASSVNTTAQTQARVPDMSSWLRVTARAAPTPSDDASSSAITATFQAVPSALIQAGNKYDSTCGVYKSSTRMCQGRRKALAMSLRWWSSVR